MVLSRWLLLQLRECPDVAERVIITQFGCINSWGLFGFKCSFAKGNQSSEFDLSGKVAASRTAQSAAANKEGSMIIFMRRNGRREKKDQKKDMRGGNS
ncbi:hypothetical protein FHG87_010175 [Trinorchestia longiramus]|nr:hypothetical protein FHG87_010175 [Trinorchestia longiramus]